MKEDGLYASVAGIVGRVNQLVSVRPLKSRYHGEIGDVVIGRITEVSQKRWKLDTNARLDSVLMLQSVNLPGGELVSSICHGVTFFIAISVLLEEAISRR